jgi:hypothetical protein
MHSPCASARSLIKSPRMVMQVALITFLAHIGSFVPADECTIGLTDRYGWSRVPPRAFIFFPFGLCMVLSHSQNVPLAQRFEAPRHVTQPEDSAGVLMAF